MTRQEREIIAQILTALTDKGRNPRHHDETRARHRTEWPTLHHSLDRLQRWFETGEG